MDNNIYIDQGSTFYQVIETGRNLTGYTVAAQIRKWYDSAEYEFFNVLVLNPTTGQIAISMTAVNTTFLTVGRCVYDVLATAASGDRIRLAQGQAIVIPGLTGVNPTNSIDDTDTEELEIVQGSTFKHIVELRDANGALKDLTGYSAEMQIRPRADSPVLILEMSSTNGRLELGGEFGTITMKLNALETAVLSFDVAVFDLEITAPDDTVTRILGGNVILIPNITK
jgi:hypothetical protein